MDVVIQVPAYDEDPSTLRETLSAIRDQPVPADVDVFYEAWITPASEHDRSFDVADSAGFEPYEAPQYKIPARNAAHNRAVEHGADAIVTWDADAPPLRPDVLSTLMHRLVEPSVVAVNSTPVAAVTPDGQLSTTGVVVDAAGAIEDTLKPHLHGQCSAITAEGWRAAGPFDEGLDHTDGQSVRAEEEIAFRARLEGVGRVVDEQSAIVFNNPRRHLCRAAPELAPNGYCGPRGVETFDRSRR